MKFFEKIWFLVIKEKHFKKQMEESWSLFQFQLKRKNKVQATRKEHYLWKLLCIGQILRSLGHVHRTHLRSECTYSLRVRSVSLQMSNTKAVPVVWNDFYFARSLKDRHYDRMKKKKRFCMTLLPFCGFLAALSGCDLSAERKAPTESRAVF